MKGANILEASVNNFNRDELIIEVKKAKSGKSFAWVLILKSSVRDVAQLSCLTELNLNANAKKSSAKLKKNNIGIYRCFFLNNKI